MKKTLVLLMFAIIFAACNDEAPKENTEQKNEIVAIDSASTVIEDVKNEIENSTEELDELLNDL